MDDAVITPPASVDATPEQQQQATNTEQKSNVVDDKGNEYAENFARLARRERQLRERESTYKTYETKAQEFENLMRLKDENPLQFLEKIGLSYDGLTRKLLENPKTAEQRQLETIEQKLAKWEKDQQEAAEKQQREQQEKAYHAAIGDIKKLVEANGDKYELIGAQEAFDLVLQTLGQYHEDTGKWVSYETAAEWVEEHLEQQLTKLTSTKKISSKFAPKQPEPAKETEAQQVLSQQHGAARTLSNNLAPSSAPPPTGRASTEELMQRALQAMRNQQTAG